MKNNIIVFKNRKYRVTDEPIKSGDLVQNLVIAKLNPPVIELCYVISANAPKSIRCISHIDARELYLAEDTCKKVWLL